MKTITQQQIKNYINYFNEFKLNYENGIRFSVTDLIRKHDVHHNTNTALKKLEYIDIIGRGNTSSYKFFLQIFEPIHARKTIEKLRNIKNIQVSKRKMKYIIEEQQKNPEYEQLIRKINYLEMKINRKNTFIEWIQKNKLIIIMYILCFFIGVLIGKILSYFMN